MRTVFGLVLALLFIETRGQDNFLAGIVLNSAGKPIAGASVMIRMTDSSSILGFAITSRDGRFQIKDLPVAADALVAEFRHSAYETRKLEVGELKLAPPGELRVELSEKPVELKEVVIKRAVPVMIRSDTVTFNANSFRDPEVRKLEDLLRKIQGFSVDASGKLSFNGKVVEKVLIEGDDLAGDAYQVVTKNLDALMIDKVEVINNFSANRLLGKVTESEKLGINLKIASTFKSKLSGSSELGISPKRRYNADINGIYVGQRSKWLAFGNYNNIAHEVSGSAKYYYQQEGGQLNSDLGAPYGVLPLDIGSLIMPAIGERYTRDNNDFGSALMNSWKWGKHTRFNAYIGFDDLSFANSSRGFVNTAISDLEIWTVYNDLLLKTNSRDLVGRLSFHRDAGKDQVSHADLVIGGGMHEGLYSNITRGAVSDSLLENLGNTRSSFRISGDQSWLLKNKLLQLNYIAEQGSADQDLTINTQRFISYWNLDSGYRINRQLLNKFRNRQQLALKMVGKNDHLQFEYGLLADRYSVHYMSGASISGIDSLPSFKPGLGGRISQDRSLKAVFKMIFQIGKMNWVGISGNAGGAWISSSSKTSTVPVFESGLGYSRKISLLSSFRFNYKLSKGFRKFDDLYPAGLMSGNATIINGLRFEGQELFHRISGSFNANNIRRQSNWVVSLSYLLSPRRYFNGQEIYPEYSETFYRLRPSSHMLNCSLSWEGYVPVFRGKLGSMVNVFSSEENVIINGVEGESGRTSFKMESWWISGFHFPLNLELKYGLNYARGSWDGGVPNEIWQHGWTSKMKLRAGKKVYGSLSWNVQMLSSHKVFHGLDLFASIRIRPALQLLFTGINLLNAGRIVESSVMPYSRSETEYALIGRYILTSVAWTF